MAQHMVSIPEGAIEGIVTRFLAPAFSVVSIPEGAIEGVVAIN